MTCRLAAVPIALTCPHCRGWLDGGGVFHHESACPDWFDWRAVRAELDRRSPPR